MLDAIPSQASKLVNITNGVRRRSSKTKLITITSGKGGVGKSTLTANMAFLLAKKGLRVAVFDADIGLANMQVLFNVKSQNTFFEYINGIRTLEEIIAPTPYENVYLIAGKSGFQYATNTNTFIFTRVIQDILYLNKFDILLVDTGAGLNDYVREFLKISDNILAITTTDPSALTDVYSLMKMLSLDKEKLMLCFNHTKNYQIGQTIANSLVNLGKKNSLRKDFMVEYIGNIATSPNISVTGRLRKLFANEFSSHEPTKQLLLIIEKLLINIY